jgi:hypothetical protein
VADATWQVGQTSPPAPPQTMERGDSQFLFECGGQCGGRELVTKEEFGKLLDTALEKAAQNAEQILRQTIPRNFQISLFDPQNTSNDIDVDSAVELLYIGDDQFYAIIDVAVLEVTPRWTRVWMHPSGHQPRPFEDTYNYESGSGPFKQAIAIPIKVVPEQS